jgi:hypothetical protein
MIPSAHFPSVFSQHYSVRVKESAALQFFSSLAGDILCLCVDMACFFCIPILLPWRFCQPQRPFLAPATGSGSGKAWCCVLVWLTRVSKSHILGRTHCTWHWELLLGSYGLSQNGKSTWITRCVQSFLHQIGFESMFLNLRSGRVFDYKLCLEAGNFACNYPHKCSWIVIIIILLYRTAVRVSAMVKNGRLDFCSFGGFQGMDTPVLQEVTDTGKPRNCGVHFQKTISVFFNFILWFFLRAFGLRVWLRVSSIGEPCAKLFDLIKIFNTRNDKRWHKQDVIAKKCSEHPCCLSWVLATGDANIYTSLIRRTSIIHTNYLMKAIIFYARWMFLLELKMLMLWM